MYQVILYFPRIFILLNGFAHAADPRNNKNFNFNIKNSILGSGTHLKMILRLVAPFSQSFSSFGATATHFVPEAVILARPQTLKHVIRTSKNLILDHICIAST